MLVLLQQRLIDPRRWILAAVLALFAAVFIVGGGRLLALGGSAYYLVAGLALGGSATLIARGDRRGIWLYTAMLLGTAIWALVDSGGSVWGLQARLLAFLVLGLWVFWPTLQPHRGRWLVAIFVPIGIVALYFLLAANRIEHIQTVGAIPPSGSGEWPHYGNDLGGSRFSQATARGDRYLAA